MLSTDDWLLRLERQAASLDQLERYLLACDRVGITDDLATSSYREAVRAHRRSLARAPLDVLFEFGTRSAAARRV